MSKITASMLFMVGTVALAPMPSAPEHRRSTFSVAVTFSSFALPIAMLGVMWPQVRDRFDQSLGTLGLVALVYGIGRTSTATTGRRLIRRLGMQRSFVLALGALAAASLVLAGSPTWTVFVIAIGAIGVISGALDSLGAAFITGLGDVRSAGLIHGAYGIGATVGPLVVAVVPSWRLAAAFGVLAAISAGAVASRRQTGWPEPPPPSVPGEAVEPLPIAAVVVSLLLFAAFVATEVTAGQWLHTYLTEVRDAGDRPAAVSVACFWGGLTVGRLSLSGARVMQTVDRVGMIGPVLAAAVAFASLDRIPVQASPAVLLLGGIALAPAVPWLFATTSNRVGARHVPRMAGWQLLATNAGAIGVPFAVGVFVDQTGPRIIVISLLLTTGLGGVLLLAERSIRRDAEPASSAAPVSRRGPTPRP